MLTAKLILERLDREGKLLERREQRSRSFVRHFLDLLYVYHSNVGLAINDITGVSRILDTITGPYYPFGNLKIGSPPGFSRVCLPNYDGVRHIYDYNSPIKEGEEIGTQIGTGTSAVTPTDDKMENRINHGRCGKTGVKAEFLNPSFETGDLTNWTPTTNGAMAASVSNAAWVLKDGTWFCTLLSTAAYSIGDYAQVAQDIDLTSITSLRFQLRGQGTHASHFDISVEVDGREVYHYEIPTQNDYPDQLVDIPCHYVGVHTVTFKALATDAYTSGGHGAYLDNIETILDDPQMEYGGCELSNLNFAGANGEFTIRRYFTNNSGVSITVNEVGIQSPGLVSSYIAHIFLIARDIVAPGVAVADTEILRATYVPQITV